MIKLLWSGVFALLLVSGCGWNGTPTRENDFTPLTSITISADFSAIAKDTSIKLKATGNFSGLFTRDITDQVTWSSDTPTVAGFVIAAFPSRVKGVGPGSATLTAAVGSISASFPITVSSATVATMTITPANPSVALGKSQQFAVTGTFSDATTQDLTFDVAWDSSAASVATIDTTVSKGFAQAIAVGTATISATFDGVSGSTVMTVTVPVLQSITLSQTNPSLLTLSTMPFTAKGSYSDGTSPDLTSQVTWGSSNTAVATIASDGTVTALTQGTTTISATLGSVSATTTLKATGGTLSSISISPTIVTLVKNAAVATTSLISATGTFSNGSTRDITGVVTWNVTNSSLATVTAQGGHLAVVTPLAVTSGIIITAASGSLIPATATLTVTAAQLMSIAFSTTNLALTAGTSTPLTVNATFSDGTTQDVTTLCVWTSNDTTKATVAAGGLGTERVTGVAAGSTTITATFDGRTVLIPATVMVTPRTLVGLTISPINATVQAGNQASFTATASYGDGTTVDVTKDATWAWVTDKPNVAILSDSANEPGQVVGVDSGSANLTVTFGGKTPNQTALVTVTGP